MEFLGHLVGQLITLIYHFLGNFGLANYGLAIVLMTVIIKIILFPLSKKQIESTKAMMAIQPNADPVRHLLRGARFPL